jgi:hypothetical protein
MRTGLLRLTKNGLRELPRTSNQGRITGMSVFSLGGQKGYRLPSCRGDELLAKTCQELQAALTETCERFDSGDQFWGQLLEDFRFPHMYDVGNVLALVNSCFDPRSADQRFVETVALPFYLHQILPLLNDAGMFEASLQITKQLLRQFPKSEPLRSNKTFAENEIERRAKPQTVFFDPAKPIADESAAFARCDEKPCREASNVSVRIVRSANSQGRCKRIFDSEWEKQIYTALLDLFPNDIVVPQLGLAGIFDYQKMKQSLAHDLLEYFLIARVDFALISKETDFPWIAIEVDSKYHDSKNRVDKDRLKEQIFRIGNLPLLRLRSKDGKATDSADVHAEITRQIRELDVAYKEFAALPWSPP